MPFAKPERDRARLRGVHPDLVRVVERAAELCPRPMIVVEGCRTIETQRAYVARGASKTLKSRHIPATNGYGHAVDLLIVEGGRECWDAAPTIAAAMKAAALEIGIPIEWGGDWTSFVDTPHYQLPWGAYPGAKPIAQSRTMAGLLSTTVGAAASENADGIGDGLSSIADTLAPAAAVSESIAHVVGMVKAVAAVLVVGGILWAAFARWDDGGRPLPSWAPGWLARLIGAAPDTSPPPADERG